MKIQSPNKSNSSQNKPGKIKSSRRRTKQVRTSKIVKRKRKSRKSQEEPIEISSPSQGETLELEDIESESISKFTPGKIEAQNQAFSEFEDNFKLKAHKSNIFKTPEKDDYILAGS